MAAIILVFPVLHHVALGGFLSSGGVIVWSFIAPVFVLVFDGVRRAVPWFVAFVVLILASPLVPTMRPVGPEATLPEGVVLALFAFTLSGMAANVFLVLGIFAAQRASALGTAQEERRRADQLIEAILPLPIADRLKAGARRIAEHYDGATIVFADVVGFTSLTARLDPDELVELLDALFRRFDALVDRYGIEKIKTVGDSYMVAAGAPTPRPDHAHVAARFALDMMAAMGTPDDGDDDDGAGSGRAVAPQLRVGMHSGPVVGGVLGRRRPIYDLWGDTVNIASRMESQGVPGRIQISRTTRDLIESEFACVERGMLEVRGRGLIDTWFLVGPKEA
jgi:guanylate cyclase